MKKLLLALLVLVSLLSSNEIFAQAPVAPSNGIWAILDTSYQVGTSVQGQSKAKITLQNTTITKYTGVQFRVFYDNAAFNAASVALLGSTTNLELQYLAMISCRVNLTQLRIMSWFQEMRTVRDTTWHV